MYFVHHSHNRQLAHQFRQDESESLLVYLRTQSTKAGYFNVSFLANINSPVQTWISLVFHPNLCTLFICLIQQVKITPTAYQLGEV